MAAACATVRYLDSGGIAAASGALDHTQNTCGGRARIAGLIGHWLVQQEERLVTQAVVALAVQVLEVGQTREIGLPVTREQEDDATREGVDLVVALFHDGLPVLFEQTRVSPLGAQLMLELLDA